MEREKSFFEFMPVSFFGAVMGLTALCFVWRLVDKIWRVGSLAGEVIGFLAIAVFILLVFAYGVKWVRYPALVAREFGNSVSIGFFSTVSISILLMPGILVPYSVVLADVIWLIGVVITLVSAWYVMRKWTTGRQSWENAVPAWVLPVTGTLNVPIAGNALGFPGSREICVMFFGIGIIFIVVMMTLIFARLIFETPLSEGLRPSLMILVAPFALAFNGYVGLIGGYDLAGSCFFYFTLFLLLLFGSKVVMLPRCCPFQVSWWSVSFPLGSVSIACLRYSLSRPDVVHRMLAVGMTLVTTAVILYLVIQTGYYILTRKYLR
ncbi:MAG: SLAC1 anion channel family protein [Bacteroidetes bacterium]|nr:SLAC1 anion channel family protein [Bacteroidota bacterium]